MKACISLDALGYLRVDLHLEGDLAGNINVKQVDLAKSGEQGAVGIPHSSGVEQLVSRSLRD